jgi:superfamily II DNA helicase RecQ
MVLSGVARTQARCACGKNLVAKMLCGSGDAKVKKLGFRKLSTFGLLKHLKQPEVIAIIDALIALRCLQQIDVDRFRPVVELTEFGGEVMRGQAALGRALPLPDDLLRKLRGEQRKEDRGLGTSVPSDAEKDAGGKVRGSVSYAEPDPEILAALKRWREEIADEAGVPVYFILSNDTLSELARRRPSSRHQLLEIKGIGSAKAERYGTTLLEIMAEGTSSGAAAAGQTSEDRSQLEVRGQTSGVGGQTSEISPPVPSVAHPSRYWTQRLLSAGFSVDECAAIRGLPRDVIVDHAHRAGAMPSDNPP